MLNWDQPTALANAEAINSLYTGKIKPNLVCPDTDTQAFVGSSLCDDRTAQRAVPTYTVYFPGTASVRDILTDLKVRKADWLGGSRVHNGFLTAFKSVANGLQMACSGAREVNFAGHSLGGALAMLAAFWFQDMRLAEVGYVHTFGQPRAGNGPFARAYDSLLGDRTVRLVNEDDPIPRIPWLLGTYRHAGHEIYLRENGEVVVDRSPLAKVQALVNAIKSPPGQKAELISARAHAITTYIERLKTVAVR